MTIIFVLLFVSNNYAQESYVVNAKTILSYLRNF